MTAYRFRVKFDPDPTSLWRDIVVGADRTIAEFQSAINPTFGLDQSHLWFVGDDEDYWDSTVKYQCPQEYEESLGGDPVLRTERVENAGDVTIGEMTRQLGLEQYDRICYLYDYGDEWRFYGILKEVLSEEPSDTEPEAVNEKGDSIDDQYEPSGADERGPPLPDPLYSVLPETAVPVADLRELEEYEDIVHVIPLLSIETGFGAVCERFAIQFEETGYVLENFQPGWQIVEEVDGANKTEEELLAALADAVREWHAEIAEMSGAMTGQHFGEETVEAMHVELEAELERKGYGHLL
ncbi:plasmid pRiA4b ORF-3 family protein [Halorubrum laminariae]|uniref:Plasmid pRiA4b ORF-3 family protein n=1 Tax=Halorubrum laminariae TaxID=1433523 RepID=A0ABD6C2A5_9EURY|nr:plasmid pRiA4b ORF-3 family protein [Halorubrum laminariae]